MDQDKYIGDNLRRLRKEKALTQDQLAAKLQTKGFDITRSAVAKMEVGQRHIYPNEMKALKEILYVSYDDLLE